MNNDLNRGRFVLIGLAGIGLLTGLWSGLARMGWTLPLPNDQFAMTIRENKKAGITLSYFGESRPRVWLFFWHLA